MINIKETKKEARSYIKEHIGVYAVYILVLLLLLVNLGKVFTALYQKTNSPIFGSTPSTYIILLIVTGLNAISLKIIRNNTSDVETGLYGVKNIVKFTTLYIAKSAYTFMFYLLLIIPGYIKSLALAMSEYVLIDNPNMSVQDALAESEKIMKGNKLKLFWVQLTFLLYCLLIPLTLGFITFYLVPYYHLTLANFYVKIKKEA